MRKPVFAFCLLVALAIVALVAIHSWPTPITNTPVASAQAKARTQTTNAPAPVARESSRVTVTYHAEPVIK